MLSMIKNANQVNCVLLHWQTAGGLRSRLNHRCGMHLHIVQNVILEFWEFSIAVDDSVVIEDDKSKPNAMQIF